MAPFTKARLDIGPATNPRALNSLTVTIICDLIWLPVPLPERNGFPSLPVSSTVVPVPIVPVPVLVEPVNPVRTDELPGQICAGLAVAELIKGRGFTVIDIEPVVTQPRVASVAVTV